MNRSIRRTLFTLLSGFTLAAAPAAFALDADGNLLFEMPRPIRVAPGNGSGFEAPPPVNFTCDSSNHQCQCQGTGDCFDLGSSQLCVPGTIKEDSRPEGRTCQFKY